VVKAWADAKTALGVLTVSQQLLDAAQASVNSSRRRYDKDVADILEVLNAQSVILFWGNMTLGVIVIITSPNHGY